MSYRFLSFAGIDFPTIKPVDDLSTAQSENAIIPALNANVDVLGATQATHKPQILEYTALLLNSDAFLVTDLGDFIVTETGDFLWTGGDTATTIDNWRRLRGQRGVLIRQRDHDSAQHWKYARLIAFEAKREIQHANAVLPVRFLFELSDGYWRSLTETTVAATLVLDTTTNFTVTVAGSEIVADCIIEITATNYITGIDIFIGANQKLSWAYASPSLFPTKTMIFDCGRYKVTEDGLTRYIGFNLGVAHIIQNWIELSPGANTMSITLVGGGASAVVKFYNQYV